MQIRYVLSAIAISAIAGVVFNLVLPIIFSNARLTYIGPPISGLIFIAISTYAIIKHRLLDIVVIIRKVTILGILLMIVLGIFSLVAFGLPFVFAESLPEDTFRSPLWPWLYRGLFFQPLRRAIEEFTDKWFFKGAYKPQASDRRSERKISSVIDLRVLLDSTAQILLGAFSERACGVFSVREHGTTLGRKG